jgi:hypothetical protein
MQWKNWGVKGGVALVVMAAMVGCSPAQPAIPATTDTAAGAASAPAAESPLMSPESPLNVEGATFDDPFAYCAAVGTIDVPDARFIGPEVPDVIAEGVRAAFGAEDVDLEVYQRGTFWRCMDGAVYACNVGANLPCESKADTSREPSQPIIDYCAENTDSDFIPAVVTGRTTVYEWACEDSEPVILDQYTEVDSRGYLQFIWHELTPPE